MAHSIGKGKRLHGEGTTRRAGQDPHFGYLEITSILAVDRRYFVRTGQAKMRISNRSDQKILFRATTYDLPMLGAKRYDSTILRERRVHV